MSAADPSLQWLESMSSLGARSDYKRVWDRQTDNLAIASLAVAGFTDEASMESTARISTDGLKYTVGIMPDDVVLEIGCGIARIGRSLSQECLHWVGADISGGMLRHAAARLRDRPNTTLVELATVGLQEFPRDAFDVVYCTIVFMHLLEWDRYRYVLETFRVLRPGGRCYFDNFHLNAPSGWDLFAAGLNIPIDQRPAHISMASTKDELAAYLGQAGFKDIRVYEMPNEMLAAVGRKPE
jgi:ubiquinone/menaquinone biosynthesis C-methylase UbiE